MYSLTTLVLSHLLLITLITCASIVLSATTSIIFLLWLIPIPWALNRASAWSLLIGLQSRDKKIIVSAWFKVQPLLPAMVLANKI